MGNQRHRHKNKKNKKKKRDMARKALIPDNTLLITKSIVSH